MASFSTFRYFIALFLLIFYFRILKADSNSSFYFENFGKHSNFESQLAIYGDAKVINGGSSVQISGSSSLTAGRLVCKKPIKLVEGSPPKLVSFSTHFLFSMLPDIGDGLAFVMFSSGFPLNVINGSSFGLLGERKIRVLSVKFGTVMMRDHNKHGDLNSNHVRVDIYSLVSNKLNNMSIVNLVLNSSEKLQAWIDYEAGSKRLEVRLVKLGDTKPLDPLLSYPIDLSQVWKEEGVFLGLSSSSGNSSQKCNVYSWSFEVRRVPRWIHSQPLDPKAFSEKTEALKVYKRTDCFLRVLAALIFGTGCGVLGAFVVLFFFTIFGNRRPVMPEEYAVHPVKFENGKFKVDVDKAVEDGKKLNV